MSEFLALRQAAEAKAMAKAERFLDRFILRKLRWFPLGIWTTFDHRVAQAAEDRGLDVREGSHFELRANWVVALRGANRG